MQLYLQYCWQHTCSAMFGPVTLHINVQMTVYYKHVHTALELP